MVSEYFKKKKSLLPSWQWFATVVVSSSMTSLRYNMLCELVCILNAGCQPILQTASERDYFTSLSFGLCQLSDTDFGENDVYL